MPSPRIPSARRALQLVAGLGSAAVLLLSLVVLAPPKGAQAWQAWYSVREVPNLYLWLDEAGRRSLEKAPRHFADGTFEHEGTLYPAEVRLKGHRSLRRLADKPSFSVKFTGRDGAVPFHGTDQLTLNNMAEDPTSLREHLSFSVFRELGVPSPRVAYARVFLNGEALGLYSVIETLEDVAAASGAVDRPLAYEGEYGCDVLPEDVEGLKRELGKDRGRNTLRRLAQAAQGDPHALFDPDTSPLDMPSFLNFLAASTLVGDYDGYRHAHNYRLLYSRETGRWHLLPWGLDRTFRRPLSVFDSHGWLAELCFSDASCRVQYVRTLTAATGRFEAMNLPQAATRLAERLSASGFRSPREPHSAASAEDARRELNQYLSERPGVVRSQLNCLDAQGNEVDSDGDGYGCGDCLDTDAAVHPGASERCDDVDNDCSGLADDAPACACTVRTVLGTDYHLCNWPMPWAQAKQMCEAKGLVLATLPSQDAAEQVHEAARSLARGGWWLGLTDRGHEGTFLDTTGAAPAFTRWDKGQPNARSCDEHCVVMDSRHHGKWQDTQCRLHRPFVCASAAPASP